jgi:hypothetical protein
MRRAFPLIAVTAFSLLEPGGSADVVLVDAAAGVKPAPIVVCKDAPPRTRDAAVLLADYIQKASGSRPDVVEGEPQPVPDRAIWVGVQPAVKALFPKTDFDFTHPEEILLIAGGQHVVIAGRDRWDPKRMDVETQDGLIRGKQLEYGTANAVYTFLHDRLGVRWLWPGEWGEEVPKSRSIRMAPFAYRFHPPIRARAGVFNFSTLGNKGYGRSHEWTRMQRLQLHSLDVSGGHGFGDWWDRFHETHPDFFALQPNGKRDGHPGGRNAKICESNPAVWQQWLKDVQAQIERDPTQTVFNASPNDGWSSGHCVCEPCRAWDHPDGEPRLLHWEKAQKVVPALTDRDVTFANTLGKLLEERYPGKGYRVLMMSYGHSRPAPVKARPAENVIISSVAKEGCTAGVVNVWKRYTPELLDAAETRLNEAEKAAGESEILRKRIDFVRTGLIHTRLLSEIARAMDAYWETPDPGALPRVLTSWERLEANANRHPDAINGPAIRPTTPRMAGMHPDHPPKSRGRQKTGRKPPPDDLDLK